MAFRGNESPMDYQWQTSRPVDPSSPFHKFAMANDKKHLTTEQGSRSAFNSPDKENYLPPREPNGKAHLSGTPSKNVPASPFRAPSFTTPRKAYDLDFSSGPESSPMAPTEDEDTPNAKPLPPIPTQLKKSRRSSLSNFFGRFAPRSGKGEITKPTTDVAPKRVHKKRRQAQSFEKQLARARRESEDSSDDDEPRNTNKKQKTSQQPVQEVGWITGLFTFIHTYPDAPSIIAKYLQVFFNAMILFGCLYMFYSFWATIRADVDKASDDAMQEVIAEMTACTRNYVDNRCGAGDRLPALEQVCANWELCMNRDPNAVKRASLSAHTFAEIFNSFVEPISLKTMVFTFLIVAVALLVNNATFTIYRRSQEHQDGYRQPSGQFGMHPGQHAAHMGQFAMTPGLPYQTPQQYGWNIGQGQLEYNQPESPSKDRGKSRSPEKKRLALEN
ncbi:hypothetical protein LTR70_004421 [Exophiala xenobiotica]|uniref:Brl1/Brr6 domain-containing protein n=1 Tax=Lithohypha guttulata TaxID=1690604 RepID=A0ABR0KFE9_9EURO|nr:hypothetical protein LTR24_003900 [Lithohypha guttulata]KAK5320843.1 hypothetical protein LTR70_004421 [Exophiala xenobiotica]